MIDRSLFRCDGACLAAGALDADAVERLRALADATIGARPGARMRADAALDELLSHGAPWEIAAALTSPRARPVRAVMFDKSPDANWAVAWHQDRTICVRRRIEAPSFGPWSVKDGIQHVAPPFEVLARMVTLRLHIDPVASDNAPLKVAIGSHRLGRVPAAGAAAEAAGAPILVCLAGAGDIWAYSTPVLHASERSRSGGRRRVLQVDYADFELDGGLEWLGL